MSLVHWYYGPPYKKHSTCKILDSNDTGVPYVLGMMSLVHWYYGPPNKIHGIHGACKMLDSNDTGGATRFLTRRRRNKFLLDKCRRKCNKDSDMYIQDAPIVTFKPAKHCRAASYKTQDCTPRL